MGCLGLIFSKTTTTLHLQNSYLAKDLEYLFMYSVYVYQSIQLDEIPSFKFQIWYFKYMLQRTCFYPFFDCIVPLRVL